MRRTLTILMIATACIPLGNAMPGAHVSAPLDEAGMAGLAVDAGPLRTASPLLLVPGVKVANPVSTGPAAIDTTSTGVAVSVNDGVWIQTSEINAGASIPLLPDGGLYLGAGTFNDDSGIGSRFGDHILRLERAGVLAAGLSAREATEPPLEQGVSGVDGTILAGDRDTQDETTVTKAPTSPATPGMNHAFAQSTAALARPLVVTAKVAAVATVGAGLLSVLGFALYHRIRTSATLDNDKRKSIFEAVCEQPGMGIQDVARIASVSYSTATYHLERLAGAGMIVMTPDGNKLRYYKNGGTFSESERRVLPILKNTEASRVFVAIVDRPGTYRTELAQALGVTTTTINWHLRRLLEAGLISEERKGRSAYLYPNQDGQATLHALMDKLADSEGEVVMMARRCTGVATGA